jgi:hypothetical protein
VNSYPSLVLAHGDTFREREICRAMLPGKFFSEHIRDTGLQAMGLPGMPAGPDGDPDALLCFASRYQLLPLLIVVVTAIERTPPAGDGTQNKLRLFWISASNSAGGFQLRSP